MSNRFFSLAVLPLSVAEQQLGITNYAATQLGDMVYVDMPASGTTVSQGAAGAFSSARELMSVTGQSSSATYTNLYTITTGLALDLPSGTEDGTYTAPMTVTLWQ